MSHPSDSKNFSDLSGITSTSNSTNPYDAILEATQDNPSKISTLYNTHRTARNEQQRLKLLAPDFVFTPDPILAQLLANDTKPTAEDAFVDPRHCLVFWARPTQAIKAIISSIQSELREHFPSLWLMPIENLHITVLEIAHSLTAPEIEGLVQTISPKVFEIVNFTRGKHATLVRPMLSFDAAALALSFVPAAEGEGDAYTYHHLRRDVYDLAEGSGVAVRSRYVVPSAHLTVGRWVDQRVVEEGRVKELVGVVEGVNERLRREYWGGGVGMDNNNGIEELRWRVGEEKGLVCRRGTVWYGGGESLAEGEGS